MRIVALSLLVLCCVMVAPGAKGSFPSSTDDATKPKNIIALSNPHTKTTGFQGTRIRMTEPPGTKSGLQLPLLYREKAQTFHEHLASVSSLRNRKRAKNSNARRDVLRCPVRGSVWFKCSKSYSTQEYRPSVKVPAIRKTQKLCLAERTQRVPRRS